MELIETSVFTRQIRSLLSEEEYRRFQFALASDPAAGVLVPGGAAFGNCDWRLDHEGKAGVLG